MTVTTEPAPWVTEDPDLLGETRLEGVTLPSGYTLDDCCQIATNHLWRVTGRRFTTYTRTFRPTRAGSCGCEMGWGSVASWWSYGTNWWNGGVSCGCAAVQGVELPDLVESIIGVTVEGVPLSPSAYQLLNDRLLVRTDGLSFPCCQRVDVAAGSPGTWSIDFTGGSPPPADGKIAARELAIEIARHLNNSATKTRLGARVATVSRQGVTFNVRTVDKGLTGIPLVDLFIESVQNEHVPFSVMNVDTVGFVT